MTFVMETFSWQSYNRCMNALIDKAVLLAACAVCALAFDQIDMASVSWLLIVVSLCAGAGAAAAWERADDGAMQAGSADRHRDGTGPTASHFDTPELGLSPSLPHRARRAGIWVVLAMLAAVALFAPLGAPVTSNGLPLIAYGLTEVVSALLSSRGRGTARRWAAPLAAAALCALPLAGTAMGAARASLAPVKEASALAPYAQPLPSFPFSASSLAPSSNPSEALLPLTAAVGCLCVLACLLAARTIYAHELTQTLFATRDDLHEKMSDLTRSNARLIEARELEGRAATLAERTRIARDIHDGVGHLLTRLVFQVGALRVVHKDNPQVDADLANVGATLNEALDSMRESVHALADESEDVPTALNRLARACGIGEVEVDCSIDDAPGQSEARCIVAVAREALTNAAKHGRARHARVALAEYPAFWRLTVENDGFLPTRSAAALMNGPGIGLASMRDRVAALDGTLQVLVHERFTIHVTLPRRRP